jgi:peptidoglycan/xylan/chitin deacetylase (PgdA/CDA1 family)
VGARVLILTYHGVGDAGWPLEISREIFTAHLDALAESGAETMTVSEVAAAIRAERLPERGVAVTFDDGFRSVARNAAPILAERGLRATIFCVAAHIGGRSDWASRREGSETTLLADEAELRELVAAGFEIGSHGATHAPLVNGGTRFLEEEIVESRSALETALGTQVCSFALPYGATACAEAQSLLASTYTAVCTTRPAVVNDATDPLALPRVDANFARSSSRVRQLLHGSGRTYLRARGAGARARRLLVADYAAAPMASGDGSE